VILTTSEFEGLSLVPKAQDGTDIDFTLNVKSYEVDDFGAVIGSVPASSTATQNVHVEVQAVTDPMSISKVCTNFC